MASNRGRKSARPAAQRRPPRSWRGPAPGHRSRFAEATRRRSESRRAIEAATVGDRIAFFTNLQASAGKGKRRHRYCVPILSVFHPCFIRGRGKLPGIHAARLAPFLAMGKGLWLRLAWSGPDGRRPGPKEPPYRFQGPGGRKVRAPQDTVMGNAHRPRGQGKCNRKQTAPRASNAG